MLNNGPVRMPAVQKLQVAIEQAASMMPMMSIASASGAGVIGVTAIVVAVAAAATVTAALRRFFFLRCFPAGFFGIAMSYPDRAWIVLNETAVQLRFSAPEQI